MATPVVAEPAPASSHTSAPKKKPRPNPARRQAARKRSEAEALPSSAAGTAQFSRPGLRRVVTIESLRDDLTRSSSTQAASRPAQVSRQKTEPLRTPKLITLSAAKETSPKLARTVTAPPATKQVGSLALKGPALVTGGLVGCAAGAAVLLGVQLWHDFAGAESAVLAAKSAKLSMDNLTDELVTSLKAGTYSADEALDMLRRTTHAYASTIPGGSPFVERIFREIDTVRKQRGREVDKIVAETYRKLAKAGDQGASSVEMRDVVIGQLMKLSSFASGATQDVVTRNPELRSFREGVGKAMQGPRETRTPSVSINMAVRQKGAIKQ